MIKDNFLKTISLFLFIFFLSNVGAQVTNINQIKVFLSESLSKSGFTLIDYSVKNTVDQYGFMHTYLGFITNKELPSILVNYFDKEDNIFAQSNDFKNRVAVDQYKKYSFIYYGYLGHTDLSLIKTIVIEKD